MSSNLRGFSILVGENRTILPTLCEFQGLFPLILLVSFISWIQFSSVQSLSHVQLFVTPWIASQRHPCPSPTHGTCSNSRPSSWWCHTTILSSVVPFSSCLRSFPASGSFPMSQFFASGSQSIGVSASTSVLPTNIQGRFPSGLSGLNSLQSKALSRVFSNSTVQNHQFFSAQHSL